MNYANLRSPKFGSQSGSPYLMANSFRFDVTELIEVIKGKLEDEYIYNYYDAM